LRGWTLRAQRSSAGCTAGSYERTLQTSAGEVSLKVPKLRRQTFETAIIERYRRRESSVEEALIEMYLAGSVRRMEDITEALWGTQVSPSTVSNLNKKIYAKIEAWRNRRIEGEHPYLYLDGIVRPQQRQQQSRLLKRMISPLEMFRNGLLVRAFKTRLPWTPTAATSKVTASSRRQYAAPIRQPRSSSCQELPARKLMAPTRVRKTYDSRLSYLLTTNSIISPPWHPTAPQPRAWDAQRTTQRSQPASAGALALIVIVDSRRMRASVAQRSH
jgi:hypothetical protein